jgi:serine/threonine protein kinase
MPKPVRGRWFLTRGDKHEMEQSVKSIENEKAIYGLLQSHPHPNVLYAILCVPEGIFMPRLETTLATRLAIPCITDLDDQERWINQLVSAAEWLERLGYAHGDLRPENILVDKLGDIRIVDFDATVTIGSELLLATLPFCKVDEDFETPLAGAETEQFSLGSCIYNIRFGVPPYSDLGLESPVWRKMLTQKDYPSTSGDRYGDIIQKCWRGAFPSINALKIEIDKLTTVHLAPRSKPARHHVWYLLAQCHEYVAGQRLRIGGSIAWKVQLRCRLIVWSVIRATLGVFYDGG